MLPKVAALVPAAGQSRRMGCCKQLLPLPDRPVIVRCLETIRAAGIDDIVLVLGEPYGAAIAQVVTPYSPQIVWNPDQESDMAQTLRCGLPPLPADVSGILVFVPDYPLVRTDTCRALVAQHLLDPAAILIPTWQGRKGHPVLVPAAIMHALPNHPTLRQLLASYPDQVSLVVTADEGTILDMDTPGDYQTLLERSSS
jgi:molybdenum cofactor cytidylyltransferase